MEELAIIKDIRIGMDDRNRVAISFTADGAIYSSLQMIFERDIPDFIRKANCSDLKNLNGRPIIVDINKGIMRFVRFK